jgi:myo-inositol-1(or 4)-monophosphatase
MAQASALLNIMTGAARRAAGKLNRDFGEVENLQVSKKGPADFVSAADRKSEETLVRLLSESRPGYGFLLEEGGEIKGTDPSHRFIIDPLDGTTNFLHAIPHFAISIALERHGELIAGVVYDPIRDEMFRAERYKGAFLNDRRLEVSARSKLQDCVLATGIPHLGKPGHARFLKELHRIAPKVASVRRFGSAALDLAWLAAGRYDGYWERNLALWDVAAGALIAREAGAIITDDGDENEKSTINPDIIIAGNPNIQPLLHALLKETAVS